MREHLYPLAPGEGVIDLAVDLGQHPIEEEFVELLLVAHVAVQRPRNHSKPGSEGAHAQRLHPVRPDDRDGLGNDTLAGKPAATVRIVDWGGEPQRARAHCDTGGVSAPRQVLPPTESPLTVNAVHDTVNDV